MKMKDYYAMLGISESATDRDIKEAYRKLSKKYHPDKNSGDHFFEERFKQLQEAYETLIDSTKRANYDFRFSKQKSTHQSNYNSIFEKIKRELEAEFKLKEDILKTKFAQEISTKENQLRREFELQLNELKYTTHKSPKRYRLVNFISWGLVLILSGTCYYYANKKVEPIILEKLVFTDLYPNETFEKRYPELNKDKDNKDNKDITESSSTKSDEIHFPEVLSENYSQGPSYNMWSVILKSNATEFSIDEERFGLVLKTWNIAHNNQDLTSLNSIYADNVDFYGKRMTKEQCIQSKERLFTKIPTYAQYFFPTVIFQEKYNGDIICYFMKEAGAEDNLKLYPSYIICRNIDGQLKIVFESDIITDQNLGT